MNIIYRLYEDPDRPIQVSHYVLSVFAGIVTTAVVSFLLLDRSSPATDFGPTGLLIYGMQGALICCMFSLIGMAFSLNANRRAVGYPDLVAERAGLGALVGIIPGGIAAAFYTVVAWGIVA